MTQAAHNTEAQQEPQQILLSDYKKHDYALHHIDLTVDLHPTQTLVTATSQLRLQSDTPKDLILDGERMILKSVILNGCLLSETQDYQITESALIISKEALGEVAERFTLKIQTQINPQNNTELEGLYLSNGMFCTQCESQGFRRITYFIDRPDNMAEFFVTVIEAKDLPTPILLSNGNLIEEKTGKDGRKMARWHDPFKKPAYLFALVGGDLACQSDKFITQSGREIDLKIYVNHGNVQRTDYAMDSLKRSMKWDEDVYDLEYDLDLFMIVAVDDFNFGAMENKGLNIFNSKYILADPKTATDIDYEHIEGVVAHEYFHNWTGNRVTCRDWFQLCLKEGLTVFRDQSFSGDMRSNATKRIDDVIGLRAHQFSEDAGPLAHPVRPEKYIEINNFYTSTVYEKGAELCRMLHLILGKENFFKGIKLYFERFDGMAVTVEDFVQAMADASNIPLSQFLLWYKQAGTPHIKVQTLHDTSKQQFTLTLTQSIENKAIENKPFVLDIPILVAFINQDGSALNVTYNDQNQHEHLIRLTAQTQDFVFGNVTKDVVPSLLRQFSAPIIMHHNLSDQERLHLMRYDTDSFNRYDAGQKIGEKLIYAIYKNDDHEMLLPQYLAALQDILLNDQLDPAFKAYNIALPSLSVMLQNYTNIDPAHMYQAREKLRQLIGGNLKSIFEDLYRDLKISEPFAPTAEQAGQRQLRNAALGYLIKVGHLKDDILENIYQNCDNMTDQIALLTHLSGQGGDVYHALMADFYKKFEINPLVIDKWFALQARSTEENIIENVKNLLNHQAFSYKNPNRARALIGVFLHANPAYFHTQSGYQFAAEQILILDAINPKTAARLATAFETTGNLSENFQKSAREVLENILDQKQKISNDLYEIISKILK